MKQLLNVLLGALIMSGYFLYESILFGTVIWYVWNVTGLPEFTTLGVITWFQAVGILFIIKIIRFDSSKLEQRQPSAIVLQNPSEKEE
jgi:hypothetical protein